MLYLPSSHPLHRHESADHFRPSLTNPYWLYGIAFQICRTVNSCGDQGQYGKPELVGS